MSNVVVTSKGTNGIYVDFGDYEPRLGKPQGFNSVFINHVYPEGGGVVLKYEGRDAQTFYLSHNNQGDDFMIVDNINGATPTSQDDLIEKLTALM